MRITNTKHNHILCLYIIVPIIAMLRYSDLSRLKRLSFYLKNKYLFPISNKIKFSKLKNDLCFRGIQTAQIDQDTLSYITNVFSLTTSKSIAEWTLVNDEEYGGSSKGDILFDQTQNCIRLNGTIDSTQRQKMIFYPSVTLSRHYQSWFQVGPFNTLQIQAKTDGKPLEVAITTKSPIQGQVRAYGTILSKIKDWKIYQLPLINMVVRGSQQDPKGNSEYFASKNSNKVFENSNYSMHKLIATQLFKPSQLALSDINIRLLSTKDQERFIDVRNINLVHRKGYRKFISHYKRPYFYIVDNDQVVINKQTGRQQFITKNVKLLKDGFNLNSIDTGDVKFVKKN